MENVIFDELTYLIEFIGIIQLEEWFSIISLSK